MRNSQATLFFSSPFPYALALIFLMFGCGLQDPAFNEISRNPDTTGMDAILRGGGAGSSGKVVVIKDDGDSKELKQVLNNGNEEDFLIDKYNGSYDSSILNNGKQTIGLDGILSDSRFKLINSYHKSNKTFTQINRPFLFDTFTQGELGDSATDNFVQNDDGNGVLDLLIVIDNSGSMAQEQNNLATKLNPLLTYVSQSDWQIGIVTTDPRDGCMRELIKKGEANIESRFNNAIQAGVYGTGNEQGIQMSVTGLKGECLAQPWVRANSTVATLIVSDEDNCSNGSGCSTQPWKDQNYLLDYLSSIRTLGTTARVYGIFWSPTVNHTACSTAAYQANQYYAAVTATSGTWGSICEADYSNTLQAISQDISTILKTQFALSHTPDTGSVKVTINGSVQSSGWSVAGNIISFNNPPEPTSSISVSYTYGSTPIFNSVTLNQNGVADDMEVAFNGTNIDKSLYSFNDSTNTVEFSSTPPEGTNINIKYRKDISLLEEFEIGKNVDPLSIEVKINDALIDVNNFYYKKDSGKVEIDPIPSDGDVVKISYLKGEPVLAYPYSMKDGQQSIEVYDLDSLALINVSYDGSTITFDIADFEEGRWVGVRDPEDILEDVTSGIINLDVNPIASSVKLTTSSEECDFPNQISVFDNVVNIKKCVFNIEEEEAELSYNYLVGVNKFKVDSAFFDKTHSVEIWRVWLNGVLITDYEINDNHEVIFNNELPESSGIKIEVSLLSQG